MLQIFRGKKSRNRIKKEKLTQKKLRDFNQEKESRFQMESQVMTLQKENRLLKHSLRESRKHIGSRVSSKPYFSTFMSMSKDKSNETIKNFKNQYHCFIAMTYCRRMCLDLEPMEQFGEVI